MSGQVWRAGLFLWPSLRLWLSLWLPLWLSLWQSLWLSLWPSLVLCGALRCCALPCGAVRAVAVAVTVAVAVAFAAAAAAAAKILDRCW